MSPKQQRIVDGHYDFPRPKGEWLETDWLAYTEDGTPEIGIDRMDPQQSTASVRIDAVKTKLDMSKLATANQKRKFKRNILIYLAHSRGGLSQRFLAEALDLPRSWIGEICKEFEELTTCSS